MNLLLKVLTSADRFLGMVMKWISLLCMFILLVLLAGNVFVRFVPILSFHWFDEIVEWAFAWLVFFGAAALWRNNDHFRIEWLHGKLEGKTIGKIIDLLLEMLSFVFFTIMAYQGLRHTILATQWTPIFNLPKRLLYLCVPVSGTFMMIYSIRNIVAIIYSLYQKLNTHKNDGDMI